MRPSSKSGLSCTDICDILDSCSKNGVYTLEFEGLKVTVGKIPADPYLVHDHYADIPVVKPSGLDTIDEMEHNEEDTKESAERLADMMEELKLTDPVAYEEIQLNGEILDA